MQSIALRPVTDADLPQLEAWLRKPYILRWYLDADAWLEELRGRDGAFAWLHHFIVTANGAPIGFGQYYDCFDAREDWYDVPAPGETYSIDYLIGEEACLGRGFGKAIVRALTDRIAALPGARAILVQPDRENAASCGALLSNGYAYDEALACFRLPLHGDS